MSKRPIKDYEELTLSTGMVVKVHRVPQALVRGIVPGPRPRRPIVKMQIAGSKNTQERAAKDGDAGYDGWLLDTQKWATDRDALQAAVSLTMALREVEYPDPIVLPPEVQALIDEGWLPAPTNPYAVKAMYLKATLLAGFQDEMEVEYALQRLSGLDPEVIEQVKASFRNNLLGQAVGVVGAGVADADDGAYEATDVQ